jgi:hypothetical protein
MLYNILLYLACNPKKMPLLLTMTSSFDYLPPPPHFCKQTCLCGTCIQLLCWCVGINTIEILELEQVGGPGPANIFGERIPCKKLADLHSGQGNLLQRNNFSVVYIQNISSLHKIGWRSAEKITLFSTCVFYVVLRFL